ncbi:MAG: hypothetical protein FWB91_11835 [Defluviitaleaceae bacterium]|nr:hypothetical protein [Defluviitaleaceae bacterium]
MQVEFVAKASILTDCGTEWVLEYFVENHDGQFYSLRVDKSTPDGVLVEREETPAMTENHEEAMAMAEAFAQGSVPPVVLLEMADEWHSMLPT